MQRVTNIQQMWKEIRETEHDLTVHKGVALIVHKDGTVRQGDPFPCALAIQTGEWREASKAEADAYFKAQKQEAATAAKGE